MANIYENENQQGILVYPFEHRILLRSKVAEAFGRPVVWIDDYKDELCDVFYRDQIYCSYRNQSDQITVRCVNEPDILFQTSSPDVLVHSPHLSIFCGRLLLFYCEKKTSGTLWSVCGVEPLNSSFSVLVSDSCPVCPRIHLLSSSHSLFLCLSSESQEEIYKINPDMQVECISSELANALNALSSAEEEQKHLHRVIDHIAKQYDELMNVAVQYRQEAKKWHDQYIQRFS